MYVVSIYILKRDVHIHINIDFFLEQLQCLRVSKIIGKSTSISTRYMNQNQSFGALHLLVDAVCDP